MDSLFVGFMIKRFYFTTPFSLIQNHMMNSKLTILFWLVAFCASAQPTLSFTFDDGITNDMPGYTLERWNGMLLDHLDQAGIKSILFSTGNNKSDRKGQYLLDSWNGRGHRIGNHTCSHLNYNSKDVSFEQFSVDFLKNDPLIRAYSNYSPLFRFPYLKEGDTREKVTSFRNLLKASNYQNGSVTIDASDWYIDSRLRNRLRADPDANVDGFKNFYMKHLLERATYYENLAFKITGRHVHHTLLLHHNLASALFLGDLIKMFREKGWKIMDAEEAFKDDIFQQQPANVPAGESLIWALAKESGKFDNQLRYPAEDSRYEKDEMDRLGL
jgi:peptidoglycan-N-acetylglucosamine deacetylase